MTHFTEAPIFDADQHMYETPDALTKYLPERYRKAVQFVQIGKRNIASSSRQPVSSSATGLM